MTRMEESQALRDRTDVHYNCCQSVLAPFAEACGLDRDTAFRLASGFGKGMRHDSTCGAVTGALMVLGLMGRGAEEQEKFLAWFREKNGALDCGTLLGRMDRRGEEHKPNCDRMVCGAAEYLEQLLK